MRLGKLLVPHLALLAVAAAAAARAEVVDVGENGFLVRETVTVDADAAKAWSALVDVGRSPRRSDATSATSQPESPDGVPAPNFERERFR